MSLNRTAPRDRTAETRHRRGFTAFALLASIVLAACAHTPAPVAPEAPRPGPDLARQPSPLFDDETRPGTPAQPGKKTEASPFQMDLAPSRPADASHPFAKEKPPAGGSAGIAEGNLVEASTVPAVAKTVRDAPTPSARSEQRKVPSGEALEPRDPLEDLFQSLRSKFNAAASRNGADDYSAIERADLESKLIALFFLRDTKKIEDYRDLFRSFREEAPSNVELELLKAALYQKVGQTDLRDRALERIREIALPSSGTLKLAGLSFAKEIRGYRSFTPLGTAEFSAGEEVLIYGEIEGFRSTPLGQAGRPAHRRSFAAELVLRDGAGAEIDRRELLRAGHAVEVVEDPSKPVHFWGRYPFPARIAPGPYRIEIEAQDLEAQRRAKGRLALRIR